MGVRYGNEEGPREWQLGEVGSWGNNLRERPMDNMFTYFVLMAHVADLNGSPWRGGGDFYLSPPY